MIFAVLVNLVLLASPPFWFVNWLSPKNQPCAGQVTTTWPRWLLRKSHLENLKFLCLMVKCIFGASVTGTNLSLSRSLVNQVKGIYCLGSQLTSWGIVLVSLKGQGQGFQVQTNRICILRFQTFLVPMQSQWKIWYLIPNELIYVLQRNSELNFWL